MSKKVGEKIRQIRVIKGLSQDNVADEIGMSPGNYGKIERGEIDVNSTHLMEIAKALKVNVSDLFDEKSKNYFKENRTDYGYVTREDFITLVNSVNSLAKEMEKLREDIYRKKTTQKSKRTKKQ